MDYIDDYINQLETVGDVAIVDNIEETLHKAAQYFVTSLKQGIAKFYASYSPVVYVRTGGLYPTIDFNNIGSVEINGTTANIEVAFNDDTHASLWGQKSIDAFWLMNSGYAVSSGWHKDIPYFGYRPGAHYIEDAKAQTERAFSNIGLIIDIDNPYA